MATETEFRAVHLKLKAEEKFLAGDITGARILAHNAFELDSSIPGIPDMVAAIDVLFAAATKKLPSGQTDWFCVLGVDTYADLGTAKKRYMTLALQTHPDKNLSAAAGPAFRIAKQAWDVVSSLLAMGSSSTSFNRGARNTSRSSNTEPSMPPRSGGGRSPSASEASTPPCRCSTRKSSASETSMPSRSGNTKHPSATEPPTPPPNSSTRSPFDSESFPPLRSDNTRNSSISRPSKPPRSWGSWNFSDYWEPSMPPQEHANCPRKPRRPTAKAKKGESPVNIDDDRHDQKFGRSRSKAPSTGKGKYACPFCHVEFSCSPKTAWDNGGIAVLMRCPACQERIYVI